MAKLSPKAIKLAVHRVVTEIPGYVTHTEISKDGEMVTCWFENQEGDMEVITYWLRDFL